MFIIVMGVTGCGKNLIGTLMAEDRGLPFYDADDYHSLESRAKMGMNVALDDTDRWPWLEHLAELAASWETQGGAVLACSALKQAHREVLVKHVPRHRIVYLELSRAAVERRLDERRGKHEFVHDFDRLLDGQFRDLEPPTTGLTVSAEQDPNEIVKQIRAWLDEQ